MQDFVFILIARMLPGGPLSIREQTMAPSLAMASMTLATGTPEDRR